MTATLRLDASDNATFRLTLSVADLARTTDLDGAVFRMDARRAGAVPATAPAFRWASSGEPGLILFDAARAHIVIAAALKDIRALSGKYDFDLRVALRGGGVELLAKGMLAVARGVTLDAADATSTGVIAIGDTVAVTVVGARQPVAIPMSASKVLLAADAARAAAEIAAAEAQAAAADAISGKIVFGAGAPGAGVNSSAAFYVDLASQALHVRRDDGWIVIWGGNGNLFNTSPISALAATALL